MYASQNPQALKSLLSTKAAAASADEALTFLAELRVSQLNGCGYCVDLHTRELQHSGFDAQKIACLTVWKESGLFNETELHVLELAEAMTLNPTSAAEPQQRLVKILGQKQTVDRAYRIATMNALNRLSITFGDRPERRPLT